MSWIGLSSKDRSLALPWIEKAEESQRRLESFLEQGNSCNTLSLQLARLRGSNTLVHGTSGREYWNQALELLWKWIQEDRALDLDAVFDLHRVVLGEQSVCNLVRDSDLYSCGNKYPSPRLLRNLLDCLASRLPGVLSEEHPIFQAAFLYQGLVSIHPFRDANGRTARLAADWVLARSGYPPLVFMSPVAAMIPLELEKGEVRLHLDTVTRVATAVETSATILMLKAPA